MTTNAHRVLLRAQARVAALEAALRSQVICEDDIMKDGKCLLCHVWWRLGKEAHRSNCVLAAPAAPRDLAPPTGCADDELPGTADAWRKAAAPREDGS